MPGNGETILLVEDERELLAVMKTALEGLNYKVASAYSGQEAIDLIEGGQAFDLLLTDVVMPGKVGGFELARWIRERLPEVPVIYTSGYTGFTRSEMGEVQAPLLQKPAPQADLANAIRNALEGDT